MQNSPTLEVLLDGMSNFLGGESNCVKPRSFNSEHQELLGASRRFYFGGVVYGYPKPEIRPLNFQDAPKGL